jgi:hypothetical protein
MKKFFIMFFVLAAVNLFAADLVNKDSASYDISVEEYGTTHTSIGSSTTISGGAPNGSTITVKSTGSKIKVNGSADVIIKDGSLSQ